MFHYSAGKKSGQDKNKNQHKFLDSKRDTHARLKALQRLLELQPENEEKQFFQDHSTEIFYLFYEEFTNLELNAKSKGAKLKDELEELLALLEKIFINLADELYARWQFNCVGLILRKLLHHGNVLAIREQGLKLFMLWLLILQEKIDEFHLAVFGSIVPGFPSPIDKINIKETHRSVKVIEYVISCVNGQGAAHGSFSASLESETEWCVAEGGSAICPPQQGDKVVAPEDLTKKFLERLLHFMTSRMLEIQWDDKHKRESGFYHIFSHFKRFYLPEIFPLWNPTDRLYTIKKDIISVPITEPADTDRTDSWILTPSIKIQCQSAILGWLIKFTAHWLNKPKMSLYSASISVVPDETDGKETPVESTSIDDELLLESAPIVRYVLYATKDNVLLVHEIFRQGFLMPLSCSDIMIHILNVYKEWFFKVSERPLFMQEPKANGDLSVTESEENNPPPSPLRTSSYKEAVLKSETHFLANIPVQEVRAGFHANLRLFIALTGQVFFVKQQKDILSKHADICKKVMKLYRNIVLDKTLDALTWRQLLIVLLKIIDHIFTLRPPSPRYSTLGGQLGSYLLQTLFVTWVRASLEVYLTLDLWDELLRVGSCFTCWEEMIKEWAGTMETLTRVMARTVYGIDLNDPPLSQLTQRGNLRKFKKISGIAGGSSIDNSRKSLSGWTRFNESNSISIESPATTPVENKEKTLLSLGSPVPSATPDKNIGENKGMVHLQINDHPVDVKITEETLEEVTENGFDDQFVTDEDEPEELPEKDPRDPFASTGEDASPADFADFAAHFPEASTCDADSDSEFGDSELESNGEDNSKILYETLNDAESVSSSLNIHLSHSLISLDSFLSESSQNLLAEDYDTSDQSDRNMTKSMELLPITPLLTEEEFARCIRPVIDPKLFSSSDSVPDTKEDMVTDSVFLEGEDVVDVSKEPEKENESASEENELNTSENEFTQTEKDFTPIENDYTQTENFTHNENDFPMTVNDFPTTDNDYFPADFNYHSSEEKFDGKLDTELMISGTYSDSTYTSDEHMKSNDYLAPDEMISPLTRLSEQDLINFDMDVHRARRNPDNQSIDSHIFTSLIDNESFNTKNSHNDISDAEAEIGEAPIAEKDMETLEESIGHVRFAEANTENSDQSLKCLVRAESFKSPDSSTRSVIEGGMEIGWTQVSSIILWKRILGILGNVNNIKDSEMHGLVFQNLIQLWQMLETIKANQGISIDNKSTPVPAALTPPLYFCSTWCLQAMAGDVLSSHKPGRIRGFKLMCMMIIRNHGLTPSPELMTHFFRLLHIGLTGKDQDVANAIIAESALFYTREFESSSCLFLDFIHAANTIISTQYMTYPRKEAISLLGSMICLAGAYPSMKVYQPGVRANETQHALTGKELREKILIPVLKAAKNDPSCRARCVALSCLGLFVVESLVHWKGDQKIYECLALIISSLEFHSQTVCAVALDILVTLTYYHKELAAFDENLPLKVVEAICHITLQLHSAKQTSTSELKPEEAPEYMSKLVLCLLDWLMVIPPEDLLKPCSDRDNQYTYLGMAMKTFKRCSEKTEWYRLERRRSLNINQIFVGDGRPLRLARVHNDLCMDDPQGVTDEDDTDSFHIERNNRHENVLLLTANYCIDQILNYYQHFPFDTGAVQPTSVVLENDDHADDITENQSGLIDSKNVQFLLLNKTTLISAAELPQVDGFDASFQGLKTTTRFVLRDVSGKYCWDVSGIFDINQPLDLPDKDPKSTKRGSVERKHSRNLSVSVPRLTTSCSTQLPTWETSDANVDQVDQLLRYIGHSSPECLLYEDQPLNIPAPVPDVIDLKTQSAVVTAVLKQHNEEENYVHEISNDQRITASEITPPEFCDPSSPFHYSKLLLHQLNYFSWENRPGIELLERNEKLLRDIKNLDKRPSRETQKIAVFYVGPGQEDKHSILSNSQGSPKFEEFITGMGWEVDLATHTGFMGGLEKNLSTGASAPYFATHSLEVIFHVSTRMPGSEDEELKTKLRHLGNDEIHIVWSEHQRDFRRGIINTEFGDVLIIIYPMQNNLFRIHIDRDPKIPPFGPLYDGVIIDGDLLPRLVRCAAINAGRVKRSTLPFFNRHYEERARCIREIAQSRVRATTFEEFCGRTFSPRLPPPSNDEIETQDGIQRTHSVPSRVNIIKDTSVALNKLLDLPDRAFRDRSSTSVQLPHHTHVHGKHSFDGGKL